LVVTGIFSVMVTLGMTSFVGYSKSSAHKGAARQTVAYLRNAQVKAVTEARTWECRFTTTKLDIYGPSGLVNTFTLDSNLQFVVTGAAHGFAHDGVASNTNCFFYAKGTATPGTVGVKRLDNGAERHVSIEALTARVSYCADPTAAAPCALS